MLRRCLLLLLLIALPIQGALAASRVCVALTRAPDAAAAAGVARHHHPDDSAGTHRHAAGEDPAALHEGRHAPSQDVSHHPAGSCEFCAACCLAVAIAPPPPVVAPAAAAYAAPRALVVSAPPGVADGLERPPRTI